jgi:hypothetical protein
MPSTKPTTPKFTIGSITVTYPQVNPPFNPVVFTTDINNRITRGWWGTSDLPDGPLKIPTSETTTNVPQPVVITNDAQYQLSYASAGSTYVVSMLNEMSTNPYPTNQTALWTGTDTTVEFVLNIDVSVSPNAVTLTAS